MVGLGERRLLPWMAYLGVALCCGCAHATRERAPIFGEPRSVAFLEAKGAPADRAVDAGSDAAPAAASMGKHPGNSAILASDLMPVTPSPPITLSELEPQALENDPHVQAEVWALERAESRAAATGLEFGPYVRGNYSFVPDTETDGIVLNRVTQRATFALGASIFDRHLIEPHVEAERQAERELAFAALRKARADALGNVRRIYLELVRDRVWIEGYAAIEHQASQLLPRIDEAVRRKELLATDSLELQQAIESSRRQLEMRRQLLDQRLVILVARLGRPAEPVADFAPINQRCRLDPAKITYALASHPDVVMVGAEGRRKQAELKRHPYDRTTARVEVGYAAEQNVVSGYNSGPSAAVRFEMPLRQGELRNQNQNEVALLEAEVHLRVQTMGEQRAAAALEKFSGFLNLRTKQADLATQLDRERAEYEMIATRRHLGQQTANVSEFAEWQAAYRVARSAIALRDAALQAEIAFYDFLHEMGCELLTSELPLGPPESSSSEVSKLSPRPQIIKGTWIAANQWLTSDREKEFLVRFCQQRRLEWLITPLPLAKSPGEELHVKTLFETTGGTTSIWLRAETSHDVSQLTDRIQAGAAAGIVLPVDALMSYLCVRLGTQVPIAVEIELKELLDSPAGPAFADTHDDRSSVDAPWKMSLREATQILCNATKTAPGAAEALLRGHGSLPSFWLIVGELDAFEKLDWTKMPARLPLRLLVRVPRSEPLRESDLDSRLRAIVDRSAGRDVQVGLADFADYRRIATR